MKRRGLTPNERSIMLCLAIGVMAERTGSDAEAAEDMLDGRTLDIDGDERDITLWVGGELLVRAPRTWMTEIAAGG